MKKLILIFGLIAGGAAVNHVSAQIRFSVNARIGLPAWIAGGNAAADYYYIPEIDAYYNVPMQQFVYLNNGAWVFSASLPGIYAGFDLFHSHHIPVYGDRPYLHADFYRQQYAAFRTTGPYFNRQYAVSANRVYAPAARYDNRPVIAGNRMIHETERPEHHYESYENRGGERRH